jgi:hypothetical protein
MKKTQLKALKSDNKFENYVINYLLSYGNVEEMNAHLQDIIRYGVNNGSVAKLVYYKDTSKIFAKYQNEILDILREYEESTGERLGIQENFTDWAVKFAFESVIINLDSLEM